MDLEERITLIQSHIDEQVSGATSSQDFDVDKHFHRVEAAPVCTSVQPSPSPKLQCSHF